MGSRWVVEARSGSGSSGGLECSSGKHPVSGHPSGENDSFAVLLPSQPRNLVVEFHLSSFPHPSGFPSQRYKDPGQAPSPRAPSLG